MKNKSLLSLSLLAVVIATIVFSCKKKYDEPPMPTDPSLTPTMSIKAFKAKHTVSGAYDIITEDIIIAGTVIANDKSGNLYKEIYIRDLNKDSGCIALELASSGLYANYPVGKHIYVKCKGLCLSDYKNMMQLGFKNVSNGTTTLTEIPSPLIANYLVGGSLNNDASPKVVTAADLGLLSGTNNVMQTPLLGDLITLSDYEFQIGDTKRSYADTSNAKNALASQVKIKQCNSTATIIVQTSGYADFAGKSPQAGNGTITALFTTYSTTPQLLIRDTTDVKFTGPRCNLFEDDFNNYPTVATCANITGWKNITEEGDKCYTVATHNGGASIYAKVTAFVSNSTVPVPTNITSWLITPAINLPTGLTPKLFFGTSNKGVIGVGTFKVLISTNYNGGLTPSTATWTELATIPNTTGFSTPFRSWNYDLTSYAGQNVYIGYKYQLPQGTQEKDALTFEIDDIKITKN